MSERALPAGWAWATVGEAGRVQLGRQRSPEHHQGDHMRPYLRVANVFEDRIDTTDVMEMNFTPEEFETYRLHHGDILLNEGQSRELVGRPAMFRGELDGVCFTNSLVRYQASAVLVQEFALYQFRYWLRSGDFSAIANITTNIAHLGAGRFAELKIALPPVAEQRRIVAKLDELLARSRRAREELAEVPALLARYRESVLAAAFRGDLTADWREAHPETEPASALLERIRVERRRRWEEAELAKLTAKGKAPKDDRWKERYVEAHALAEYPTDVLPAGWTWVSAEAMTWDITVGHVGPMKDQYVAEGVPFLRSMNVRARGVDMAGICYVRDEFHRSLPKSELRPGDVLVVRSGAPGTSAVVPEHLSVANCSDLVIARPHGGCLPSFLSQFINSPIARTQIFDAQVGVAQQHFNVGSMAILVVPLAPLAEQREIVRRIEVAFARVDAIEAVVAEQRARLDAYDRSLLARAFAGELVPQDPADEPAAALLARLRAERDEAPPTRGRRRRT